MFPNVLVPTPLHTYSRQLFAAKSSPHGSFLSSSSAFLMDNLLNERRCSEPPSSPPASRDTEYPASPEYESSGSPCPTDYRVRKDRLSPNGDSSVGPEDQDQSGDSSRLRSRLDVDTDSRNDARLEPDDRWTPKRDFESSTPPSHHFMELQPLQQRNSDSATDQLQRAPASMQLKTDVTADLQIKRDKQSSPEHPEVASAFTSDSPAFRHFYHSDVFKNYTDGLGVFKHDSYVDQKTRFCELYTDYKQNVVVLKPNSKRALESQTEKETPVLKFSVNAILGTDPSKNPPLAKYGSFSECCRLRVSTHRIPPHVRTLTYKFIGIKLQKIITSNDTYKRDLEFVCIH
ncbi:hypothetical protein J6590_022952 [Homalodisca vitripennis]|nr:hypothetical protein J6590_022952 [Homalodisca vitripennis]